MSLRQTSLSFSFATTRPRAAPFVRDIVESPTFGVCVRNVFASAEEADATLADAIFAVAVGCGLDAVRQSRTVFRARDGRRYVLDHRLDELGRVELLAVRDTPRVLR